MNAEEARKRINRLLTDLEEIPDGRSAAHWDADEALLVWDALSQLAVMAGMLMRSHGATLAARLPSEYTHPTVGVVHWDTEHNTKWDGNAVLNALGRSMADTETGEIQPAVPVDTLRKVLPACQPKQTSSKWNKTGLQAAGIQPAQYSTTDWGAKVLRRGPKYRPSKPPAGNIESTVE